MRVREAPSSKNVFTYFYKQADIGSKATAFSPPAPKNKRFGVISFLFMLLLLSLHSYTVAMTENFPGERCPARDVKIETGESSIWDSSIPEQCLQCLQRARSEGAVTTSHFSSYDVVVRSLNEERDGSFEPENADKWSSTEMIVPDKGDRREFVFSVGFDDSGGDSYGLETDTTTVRFTCDKQ